MQGGLQLNRVRNGSNDINAQAALKQKMDQGQNFLNMKVNSRNMNQVKAASSIPMQNNNNASLVNTQ